MCNTKVFIAYRDGLTVVGNYSLWLLKPAKLLIARNYASKMANAWNLLH